MKFLDQAKVYVRSGNGGAGSVSFLREKFLGRAGFYFLAWIVLSMVFFTLFS